MRSWLVVCLLWTLACAGCSSYSDRGSLIAHGGTSAPKLMIQYGCPTCHVIPGVPGAVGKVGPPLNALAQRSYLAGTLPNSAQNLQQWLMHPQAIRPGSAMPDMGVTQSDAQEMALFLQSDR